MLVIAENLNTRNSNYMNALKKFNAGAIKEMSKKIVDAGANIINIQCSLDGSGDEEMLPKVVEVIANSSDAGISLDTRNAEALKICIPLCKTPPLVNYLSLEEANPEQILSICRDNRSSLIIRALKGIIPTSFEGKLQVIEELIEMANAADIPNERLFADPSVVHIGRGMGQDHLVSAHACIAALNHMVEPPINTISWISNVSSGLSKSVKSRVNSAFLNFMAGAGLDAAIVDVFDSEIMKTVYLLKAFKDEIIFSEADMEGK